MEQIDLTEGFEAAYSTIEKCLSLVAEEIYDREIKFRARKFGIFNTLELMFAVVENRFIRFDDGRIEADSELAEPLPPNSDTWVRSAIPVHKKFITPKIEKTETVPQIDTKSSFKTSFYRSNTLQKLMKKPSKIWEEPTPFPMEIVEVKMSDEEEFIRLRKEREWKRKQDELVRLKSLESEEKNKRKLLARQLGGNPKNYTFDYNGKILMVNPIKTEKEAFETVEFKVVAEEKVEEKPKSPPRTAQGFGNSFGKKKILEPIQEKPLKQVYSLSILEHIRLAPGVSIGGSNRSLPITRNPEISKQKSIHKRHDVLPKPQESSLKPAQSTKLLETVSESAFSLPKPSEKKINTERISKQKLLPITTKKINKVKQYTKEMIGAEDLSEYDKFNLAIISNREWGKNPPIQSVKIPARVPKVASAKDQWDVFGYLAKKPKDEPFISAQELWEMTSNLKKPRERAYIEKVQHKTKPPPPPLGKTMLISYNSSIS